MRLSSQLHHLTNEIANSSTGAPILPPHDRSRITSYKWRQNSRSQGYTCRDYRDVQEADEIPSGATQCRCLHLVQRIPMIVCSRFTQGDTVKGEISNTCDAWQASNTDGYFAVSGHWIEEPSPGVWHLESALLGFTRLNNSHNGQRLGQVLFKIVDRLSIAHKVMLYPTIQ